MMLRFRSSINLLLAVMSAFKMGICLISLSKMLISLYKLPIRASFILFSSFKALTYYLALASFYLEELFVLLSCYIDFLYDSTRFFKSVFYY